MISGSSARRILSIALLGVAGYYALLGGEYSVFDLVRLDRAQNVEAAQLARVRIEVDSLTTLVDRLENDRATIEAVARERFGMIREGEILYRFVEVEGADSAPEAR